MTSVQLSGMVFEVAFPFKTNLRNLSHFSEGELVEMVRIATTFWFAGSQRTALLANERRINLAKTANLIKSWAIESAGFSGSFCKTIEDDFLTSVFIGVKATGGKWSGESYFLACFQHQFSPEKANSSFNLRVVKTSKAVYTNVSNLLRFRGLTSLGLGGNLDYQRGIIETLTQNQWTVDIVGTISTTDTGRPINLYSLVRKRGSTQIT